MNPRKTSILAALALLAITVLAEPPAATTQPGAEPLKVLERVQAPAGVIVARLSNGLTAILKPTRTAPVVCVRAVVRAGGLYERQWLGCGISHLTEHLVAKGAVHDSQAGPQQPQAAGTRDRVTEIGAQSNASTSLDHTTYYISAASGRAMDCIDLIADWMARPAIAAEDFRREHGVVQREIEMGMDEPSRQAWYAHMANAFGTHPAAVPVIGLAAPLAGLTCQDVLEYHSRMYVPQNMVVAVVGDMDAQAALERICRAFAGFQPGRVPDLSLPEVPPLGGVRRVVRQHPALKEVMQTLAFQTIPLLHEDLYALDVLSFVLTEGQSSRLVQKVQRQGKLVTAIDSSSWTPAWGKGLFSIHFRCQPDKADAAEQAILEELRRVAAEGVGAEELTRAKRQKLAEFVYSQQTVDSQAATLASDYLATGDVDFSGRYTRNIQAVTAEQVRAAAVKHFAFDRLAVTRLVPAAEGAAATQPGRLADRAATTFGLDNGLRVVLKPTDGGLVSLALVTKGGLLLESPQTNGLGSLMAALSTKGAGKLSAEEIAAFFDQAGGGISGKCGNNSFYWQATVLEDSFARALEIFADVIIRPTYPDKELDILRPMALAGIAQQEENWQSQLSKFFRERFFRASPYAMLPLGSKATIESAASGQLAQYHRANITAGGSVLAVFGSFDPAAARRSVEALFADMPKGAVELPSAAAPAVEPQGRLELLKTDNKVAGVIVAAAGMTLDNFQDRFAMDVLDTIISGYRLPSGWMHEELRGRGLVYVVHSYNFAGLLPGAFVTYAACQPEKAPEVVEIIKANLRKASEYSPAQEEIDQAVNTILTAELLDKQETADLALTAALDELYGFGYDFHSKLEQHYRRVTAADVARVGRKYLSGGLVTVVTTPQPEALGSAASPAAAPATQGAAKP